MIEIKTFLLICKFASWAYIILTAITTTGLVAGMRGKLMETTENGGTKPMSKLTALFTFGGGTLFFGGTATILYFVRYLS